MSSLQGTAQVTSWDEDAYAEREGGRKLTRATVSQELSGDVAGTGRVQWLMCYQADGTARFVGLQELEGTVDGRSGSVVLETIGDFDGSKATGTWTVIPGSGTEGLAGMRGEGRFEAPFGGTPRFTLDCSFD
jgi:hypothetical protein